MGIVSASPALAFLNQMLSLFAAEQIVVPHDFYSQAVAVHNLMKMDGSGLVNSLLDYAISSGQVDFSVETSNPNLTKTLNSWMRSINSGLRGKVPTGIDALAKEYYRERWKESSFIVLRTLWEDVDGFQLPTKLWFASGRDIAVQDNPESVQLGMERYSLKISKNKSIPLPSGKNEQIYIQRPYEAWGTNYPIPFLIRRGIYYNLKFIEILNRKGSNVLGKAMEYLMMMKKGNVDLAKAGNSDYTYSKEDLTKLKDDFQKLIDDMRANRGLPMYTTNFDTELEHIIPEYGKVLTEELYHPIEKRILAGLGFIEVIQGATSSRKDSILNPKVFIEEVQSGVNDFKSLMSDILMDIIDKNKSLHRKFTSEDMIKIRTSPMKSFYGYDEKNFLRSLYDRGLLSKRTMVELGVDIDLDEEVERRMQEHEKELGDIMYPPVVQNMEQFANDPDGELKAVVTPDQVEQTPAKKSPSDNVPSDKKPGTPEAKNYITRPAKKIKNKQ